MANGYNKRCLTSLIIREKANQNLKDYHLTPVRMAIIKKTRNNKCRKGCRGNRILVHC